MYLTVPKDVFDTTIRSSAAGTDSVVGLLLGRHLPAESLTQIWGVTDLHPTSDVEKRVGELTKTIDSQVSGATSVEDHCDHRSEFIPPKTNASPAGVVIIGSLGRETFDRYDAPVVQIVKEGDHDYGPNDTPMTTVTVDGVDWQASMVGAAGTDAVNIVHAHRDVQKRIDGLIDTGALTDACATIVGLGTVGSTVAVELAKAGVGSLNLVDFDRLEIHNITRHVCGVDDLGRKKTRAVRDCVHRTNPRASVEMFEVDVSRAPDKFGRVAAESDVVAVCTDTDTSKLVVNRECLQAEVPAVYAGVYERAMGGDVIRIRPGETPCYDCILGNMSEEMDRDERVAGEADYSRPADDQPPPEPGLSVDVGFVSLIQTRYVLATLLAASERTSDFDRDMCFWGNESEYIFSRPLQSRFATVSYREDCRTCGGTGTVETSSMDTDIEDIVESAPELDDDPRPGR